MSPITVTNKQRNKSNQNKKKPVEMYGGIRNVFC